MPVRSLHSSVLKWPDHQAVRNALAAWTQRAVSELPSITKIGYFGSYARGDWGVGSDLDLLVIVDQVRLPFEQRASMLDTTSLPVPVDVIVYTEAEWEGMRHSGSFHAGLRREMIWLYKRNT